MADNYIQYGWRIEDNVFLCLEYRTWLEVRASGWAIEPAETEIASLSLQVTEFWTKPDEYWIQIQLVSKEFKDETVFFS